MPYVGTVINPKALCIPCTLLTATIALGVACDANDDSTDGSDTRRHIYFDAAEVNDMLESDAPESLLVDVREGNIVHFDQSEESFDWSAFSAICPSMDAPIPMTDYMDGLGLNVEDLEYWTIQSADTDPASFRQDPLELPGEDCLFVKRCVFGEDCVWVCE